MKIKRVLYFLYYLRKTECNRLWKFSRHASYETGKSNLILIIDAILSVFKYNISILDYFYFSFFKKDKTERLQWAGSGFMYEYQKIMNPLNVREVLENKILFSKRLSKYYHRNLADLNGVSENSELANRLMDNPSGKLVLKSAHGQAGQEIKVVETGDMTSKDLINVMRKGKFDLVEEYIIQHRAMMDLSPSGLNTVRIISQVVDGQVVILAARLRITINSEVDNMAAGNAAVPLDLESGTVTGPGVFSDITKEDITVHPVTGVELIGFKVPYWQDIIKMVMEAAMMVQKNRSIGWDIAVTDQGPLLVEGNHNWCKLLWQLPVKQGLKFELEKYL